MSDDLKWHIEIENGRKIKVYDDIGFSIDLTPPDPDRFYTPKHPVHVNEQYRMKSSRSDIMNHIIDLGYTHGQAEGYTNTIWNNMRSEFAQNIDEWVEGKPLSDVLLGTRDITINGLIYEWKKYAGFDPGMHYHIPRLKRYLDTGEDSVDMYPNFG